MRYPRGSEWRLWDLHIHTPASYNYNGNKFRGSSIDQVNDLIKKVVENINESDRAVYAINDYWTFDGYKALKTNSGVGEVPEITKTILPGIELRIESGCAFRLNIHVLFSDKLTFQQLEDFKSTLRLRTIERPLSEEALTDLGKTITVDKAKEMGASLDYKTNNEAAFILGCKIAEITKSSFEKALSSVPEDKRLVMIPYDCYGGMEEIDWKTQPLEDIYFMRMAQIVEDRNPSHAQLFAGIETEANKSYITNFLETIGKPKPCISGSDGHSIEHFLTWRPETSTKKTWIKADPTFEGLRQILFEPTERVRIQESNPSLEFEKQFFSGIQIKNNINLYPSTNEVENPTFATSEVPLNQNMVCIIGGRGTGKSRLMDYVGCAFGGSVNRNNTQNYQFSDDFIINHNKDSVTVETHTASSSARLPFVYISQSEVKEKVSHGGVGNELRKMLGVDTETSNADLTSTIMEKLTRVGDIEKWFKSKDSDEKLINDPNRINNELTEFRSLLQSITTETNKEKLERFTENVKNITALKEKHRQIDLYISELETVLVKLNTHAERIDPKIPLINFAPQIETSVSLKQEGDTLIETLNEENNQTRMQFSQIYSGDLSTLLSNAETYRTAIEKHEAKLREIAQKQADLITAKESRQTLPDLISEDLNQQKIDIDTKWLEIKAGREDWSTKQKELMSKILSDRQITLEGKIIFKKDVFFKLLKEQISLVYFKASKDVSVESKISEKFPIYDVESFLHFLKKDLHAIENEEYVIGNLYKIFYDHSTRSKYLYVEPNISYKNRPLEKLSVGQRGTVYLCLKLATQAFSQPLIFDQPEDDLDNEFIISELVDIFKGIKQFRQVILITHNANIVVNSDAEQVIVAENDAGILSYSSGSLECSETNKQVRLILEGGDNAFKKRELRYTIPKIH